MAEATTNHEDRSGSPAPLTEGQELPQVGFLDGKLSQRSYSVCLHVLGPTSWALHPTQGRSECVWPGVRRPGDRPFSGPRPSPELSVTLPCPARQAWQEPCALCWEGHPGRPGPETRQGPRVRLLGGGAQQEGPPLAQWPTQEPVVGPPPCSALPCPDTPSWHATLALDSSRSDRQRDGLFGGPQGSR